MKCCSNCEYGNKTSNLIAQICSKCGFGMDYKHFKLKEDKGMVIKINRKAMTEEDKRNLIAKVMVDLIGNKSHKPINIYDYADKAMEICKNEPQKVESVTIKAMPESINLIDGTVRLSLEQIKQIQAIQL